MRNREDKLLAKATGSIALAAIAIAGISAVVTPLLARTLAPSGYGRYAIYSSVFLLATIVTGLGLFDSGRRAVAEQTGDPRGGGFAWATVALAALTSAGFMTMGAVAIIVFGTGRSLVINASLLLIALGAENTFAGWRAVAFGQRRERLAELTRLVGYIVFGLAIVPTVVILRWGITGALFSLMLSRLVILCVALTDLPRALRQDNAVPRPLTERWKVLLSFGVPTMLVAVLANILIFADIILVGYFLGPLETGTYRVALAVSELLWLLPSAAQTALLHALAPLWAQRDLENIERLVAGTARWVATATAGLAVFMLALAGPIVEIVFGRGYERAVPPLRILLAGTFLLALAKVLVPIVHSRGMLGAHITATGLVALANVALNLLLIPRFGIMGAAVATSVTYAGMVLGYHYLSRRLDLRVLERARLWRLLPASGLALMTAALIDRVLAQHPIAAIAAAVPLAGGVFLYTATRSRLVDWSELAVLLTSLTERDKRPGLVAESPPEQPSAVILFAYDMRNKGDQAIALAEMDLLHDSGYGKVDLSVRYHAESSAALPDWPIAPPLIDFRKVQSGGPGPGRMAANAVQVAKIAWQALSLPLRLASPFGKNKELLESVRRADVVLLTGGGFVNDGLAYVEIGRAKRLTYIAELWLMAWQAGLISRIAGRQVILMPQSLGPFTTRPGRWAAAMLLSSCRSAFARDKQSLANCKDLPATVDYCPDMAFLLPAPAREPIANSLAVCPRFCSGVDRQAFVAAHADALDRFIDATGARVHFMPSNITTGEKHDDDMKTCEQIKQRMRHGAATVTVAVDTAGELLSRLAEMEMTLSSRLHPAVLSAVAGTPFVTVAYEHKQVDMAAEFGLSAYCVTVDGLSAAALTDALLSCWQRRLELPPLLQQKTSTLADACRAAVREAIPGCPTPSARQPEEQPVGPATST